MTRPRHDQGPDYERGFIDGMQHQMQSSVDKAVNRMAQPKQEPLAIWYMRDNHTFRELSADVSTALIEIEQEFNEGYTYGMLCSKRKGFKNVHASGKKKRLEFFAECKKTLEQWLPNTAPPERIWVGLDFDTIEECFGDGMRNAENGLLVSAQWLHDFAHSIEARLKEKNR